MNQAELDKELIRLAGLISEVKVEGLALPETCWLDGSGCPYGWPEGQFLLRPRQFCHPAGGRHKAGCWKITDNIDDLNEITRELQKSFREKK